MTTQLTDLVPDTTTTHTTVEACSFYGCFDTSQHRCRFSRCSQPKSTSLIEHSQLCPRVTMHCKQLANSKGMSVLPEGNGTSSWTLCVSPMFRIPDWLSCVVMCEQCAYVLQHPLCNEMEPQIYFSMNSIQLLALCKLVRHHKPTMLFDLCSGPITTEVP